MSFPVGLLPVEHLSNDEDTGMRVELRRNSAARKRHHYELRAETSKMSYSATNYGSQPLPRGKGTKWLVGVHHKPSGTVRLVEAQHLYHMAPRVKQPRLPLDPPESREQISNLQAKRNLVNEMGSAKAQKKQKAEMAKQISPDAVFNSANLSADLASLAQVEAPKPKTPQELRPLHPPFNLLAATPEEAYPREGLIPPRVWDALNAGPLLAAAKDAAQLSRMGEEAARWPPVVVQQLSSLPAAKQARSPRTAPAPLALRPPSPASQRASSAAPPSAAPRPRRPAPLDRPASLQPRSSSISPTWCGAAAGAGSALHASARVRHAAAAAAFHSPLRPVPSRCASTPSAARCGRTPKARPTRRPPAATST